MKTRLYTVNFGTSKSGLSTVGFTLYKTDGVAYQARSTSGVVEFGTSGVYGANISLPDVQDVLVLWDSGEVSPKYGSEDSRVQIDAIQAETEKVRVIWNSLKNQGELIATVMEKLGILEKNKGMEKTDLEKIVNDSISKIKFPEQKDIIFPEIQDNTINFARLENMVSGVMNKEVKEYTGNFKALEGVLIRVISDINKNKNDMSKEVSLVLNELKRTKVIFNKIDEVVSKILELNSKIDGLSLDKKLDKLDLNDKLIIESKKALQEEVQRMDLLIKMLADKKEDPNDYKRNILMSLGHKKRK